MTSRHITTSTTGRRVPSAERVAGVAEVMTVGVRVAGPVPTRTDLRFAGTAEQMLGLSLGTVLIYLESRELHQAGEEPAGRLISRAAGVAGLSCR